MEKSGKHYWAVFRGRDMLFAGSFNDCWQHLVTEYATATVAGLTASGIRIARSN